MPCAHAPVPNPPPSPHADGEFVQVFNPYNSSQILAGNLTNATEADRAAFKVAGSEGVRHASREDGGACPTPYAMHACVDPCTYTYMHTHRHAVSCTCAWFDPTPPAPPPPPHTQTGFLEEGAAVTL